MSVQDYKAMEKAPMDGTVVLVLAGSRQPRAAYWDYKDKSWKFWHAPKETCYPTYWTEVPAVPPSDFLPKIKSLEDEEAFNREVAHGVLMDTIKEAGVSHAPAPKEKGQTRAENLNIDKVIALKEQEEKQRDEFPKNAAYYAQKAQEGKPPFAPKEQAPVVLPLTPAEEETVESKKIAAKKSAKGSPDETEVLVKDSGKDEFVPYKADPLISKDQAPKKK